MTSLRRNNLEPEEESRFDPPADVETIKPFSDPRSDDRPAVYHLSSDDSKGKRPENKPTTISFGAKSLRLCLWSIAIAAIVVVVYVVVAPAKLRADHKKAVDAQLIQLSEALAQKKASVASQITELTETLASQKDELMSKLQLSNVSLPFVSLDHHEGEIEEIKAHAKGLQEQNAALDKDLAEKDKDLAEKQATIEQIRAAMEANKVELKQLNDEVESEKVDTSAFCDACAFDDGNLRTTCGKRKTYLMHKHGDDEEAAKTAVIEWDPNCQKK